MFMCVITVYQHNSTRHITCSLKRIRRRAGRTIGSASQEFLRVVAEDERGRSLEVVTEWQGTYINKFIHVCILFI
jgi:hypothetical protein